MVSAVGLGANQFGGRVDQQGTDQIIGRALDLGVNLIDTADGYSGGRSEEMIGVALRSRRDEVILATKTGINSAPEGRLSRRTLVARVDASLRRLGTDRIDLFYMHFPDPATPLEETLRGLDDLVRAGKILYPAISNHSAWQVAEALAICRRHGFARPAVTQNEMHLLDRSAQTELIPACRHFGVSLIPYYPLAAGFLTGKYRRGQAVPGGVRGAGSEGFRRRWLNDQSFDALESFEAFAAARGHSVGELAIAWLLSFPEVCSVIVGATSAEQVEANVRAADWRLEPGEAATL